MEPLGLGGPDVEETPFLSALVSLCITDQSLAYEITSLMAMSVD